MILIPNAFVIVSDAREVHGEGFIEKNLGGFQQKICKFFQFYSFIFGDFVLK